MTSLTTKEAAKIGQLNGAWSILLRLTLASYPLVLAWCVWVTKEQMEDHSFRNLGDRFTSLDGANMKADILAKLADLPPADWKARITAIEVNQREILTALERLRVTVEMHSHSPKP